MRRRSRELSSQMAAKILKHEQTEEFFFLKSHSKKLEASSFNNLKLTGFYHLTKLPFTWARMLVISIKQINWLFFFLFMISFKKITSKRDICVMLSYLL